MASRSVIVIPDIHSVEPNKVRPGHIVRVTDSETVAANDVYGIVQAVKPYAGGTWRVRWEAAVVVGSGEPNGGILHLHPGDLISCISRDQWLRLPRRLVPRVGATAR